MKLAVFTVKGKLYGNVSHQEMLTILYQVLKSRGIHFAGETKQIEDN